MKSLQIRLYLIISFVTMTLIFGTVVLADCSLELSDKLPSNIELGLISYGPSDDVLDKLVETKNRLVNSLNKDWWEPVKSRRPGELFDEGESFDIINPKELVGKKIIGMRLKVKEHKFFVFAGEVSYITFNQDQSVSAQIVGYDNPIKLDGSFGLHKLKD